MEMDGSTHAESVTWHVQDFTSTETAFTLERGMGRGLGVMALVPVRQLSGRVRFEDATRQPLPPGTQDIHHRNETLVGLGDPWLMAVGSRSIGAWSLAGRAGVTIPLGPTEENPFALGRQGRTHQHVQFGTGTWDPIAGLMAGRRFGEVAVTASVLARFPLAENQHAYRAGRRVYASIVGDRALSGPWRVNAGFDAAWEAAERWDGRIEQEGNLGRTDLLLSAGVVRRMGGAGALTLTLKRPLVTRVESAQLDYPVVLVLGWSR